VPELNTAVLMYIPYRHAENEVLRTIAAAGFDDLTLAQARICARIGPDGIRLTALAEQAQVTKQTAQVLVDQVERLGYVERVPDPTDGRARLIRLAERGRAVQRVARRAERRLDREWTAHLGVRRMAALRAALTDLREITDPYR
jgi:DNA-binding MarR family transcriptional regulator